MNCLYITLFFNIVAGIVQIFIKSCNQLLYSRVIEVCRLLLGRQRSKMSYSSFVRREHQSFLRRIQGTSFIKYQRDATYSVYLVYFLQLYMFRTQSASIFRSTFLQTVIAATGTCHRYGVDKPRIGVIGSLCYIPWFNRCCWVNDVACE